MLLMHRPFERGRKRKEKLPHPRRINHGRNDSVVVLNVELRGEIMGKRICLGLFICALAFSLSAFAQEVTGGIQGTVKDPQGAVIPGASVEVSGTTLIGKKTA